MNDVLDRLSPKDKVIRAAIEDAVMKVIESAKDGKEGYAINLDFSPNSLWLIDNYEFPSPLALNIEIRDYNLSVVAFYCFIGSYLGDTIRKNLGGEWEYPSRFRWAMFSLLSIIFGKRIWIFGYLMKGCNIKLGKKRIPVMKIASKMLVNIKKNRASYSKKYCSLNIIYERIRTTGDWK